MSIELDDVNEETSFKLSLAFYNSDNELQVPDALSYRIDCRTTITAVKASTALTPAASNTFIVTTTNNAIINTSNASEARRITVTATWGTGEGLTEYYDYNVINLAHV